MKHPLKKTGFGLSTYLLLSLTALPSPLLAQDWGNATLFAYETTKKQETHAAEDDILLAMKALEEASAVISPGTETANDVDIDSILLAATANRPDASAQSAGMAPSTAAVPAPASDATPPKTEAPELASASKSTSDKAVPSMDVQAQEGPKHQVMAAPTKQEQPVIASAATTKHEQPAPSPKHQVMTAPTKQDIAVSQPAPPTKDEKKSVALAKASDAPRKAPQNSAQPPSVTPSARAMQYVMAVYSVNNVDLRKTVGGRTPTISELYQYAFKQKLVYQSSKPAIGDLAFFHNSYDRNQDGRWNDWHTQVGIVENIDENHTISVLIWQKDKIQRIYLNLKYPELHKNKKGLILNTQLRPDENGQRGTTAKLFAGFANLLGSATQVTVIDNWHPDMKIQ